MTHVWRRVALLVLVATTVGCDRVSKHFASRELAGEPRQSFLADTVRLEYAENTGAFSVSATAGIPPLESACSPSGRA